jgi:predicted dehydrogenase
MKFGIVGYGSIGQRHAANLRMLGREPVVYDPAGLMAVRLERNIYETCDAVVIATPTYVHWGCIRAAAERGRHMLIEKPIANGDVPGLEASLALARSKGAVVMMGNNLRFHPCVMEAKTWMDSGEVGKPIWAAFTCATTTTKRPYLSDGVILNTGAHEVDLALHLLGPAKVLIASVRLNLSGGHEDIAHFVLQHDNGCRSSFHLDFVTVNEVRQFRIVGDDGDLFCDLPARSMVTRLGDLRFPGVVHSNHFTGPGSYDDDYLAEMNGFIDRIEGREALGATGADGIETLKILLDVRKMAGLA